MSEMMLDTILAERPCGLLTDIDGTLSPIAPTPEAAIVSAAAREHLGTLAQHLDLVAAISGRAAADAAAMVGLPNLIYVGNHGMEVWQNGVSAPVPEAVPYRDAIASVLTAAQQRIALSGVLLENKTVTASVHYRLADNPTAAEEALREVLEDVVAEHGLRLTHGRQVWEIRPPLALNKGTAARWLVGEYGLRGVLFLGDDTTDADAFAVLRELREQGVCVALNVGVTATETPAIVRELADVLVDGVPGVEALLGQVAALVTPRS